jgi:hypothetical protein
MSLVPSLSCGRSRRDGLNSLRNTFSFLSILVVYGFAVDIDKFIYLVDDILIYRKSFFRIQILIIHYYSIRIYNINDIYYLH